MRKSIARPLAFTSLVLLVPFLAGCAASSGGSAAPAPGSQVGSRAAAKQEKRSEETDLLDSRAEWRIFAADTSGAILGSLRNLGERTEIRLPRGRFVLARGLAAQGPAPAAPQALRIVGQGAEETILEYRGEQPLLSFAGSSPEAPGLPVEIELCSLAVITSAPLLEARDSQGLVRLKDARIEKAPGTPIVRAAGWRVEESHP